MTKREVAFFREKRRSPANDIVKFLQDLGYSDEQIKAHLLKIQADRDVLKAKQERTEFQETTDD